MSLDVYLTRKREEPTPADRAIALLREHGMEEFADEISCKHECGDKYVFDANITHNLGTMADAAGIYKHLWRPEEVGITKAGQLIEPLQAGLELLRSDPLRFQELNPSNGWGSYDGLERFVTNYLNACRDYPDAEVRVSR